MNELILGGGNLTRNPFFNLDHRTYEPGALGTRTREMLGLVSSLVLRCDDCVTCHVIRCHEEGVTREEGRGRQHRRPAPASADGPAGELDAGTRPAPA